ncbi:MAG: ABC transporter ATP-binding protein [Trueperaceae bacterium]|nr:ABC transporter ATP-binding protein [Trueperaceae bacterium]
MTHPSSTPAAALAVARPPRPAPAPRSTEGAGARRDATPAVELTSITKTYTVGTTVHAVDDVSLTLRHGSYTAIMGPSGSGKSTLTQLIGLLDTPTSGTLRVDGRDAGALSDWERTTLRGAEIGFVFQAFNLMPKLTVLGNVLLPMQFLGVAPAVRRARALELLERMGMSDRLHHRPNQLSGGQRQRVAIARALANDPTLILADEPTGNLDSKTGDEVLQLFDELHAQGTTLLLVTHERRVAERADRIVHMEDGRVRDIEGLAPRRLEVVGGAWTPPERAWEVAS